MNLTRTNDGVLIEKSHGIMSVVAIKLSEDELRQVNDKMKEKPHHPNQARIKLES